MIDRVVVERVTSQQVDPDTLQMVDVFTTVYEGMGRVQRRDVQVQSKSPAEHEYSIAAADVQVPVTLSTGEIVKGDRVTVTGCVLDAALVGSVFTVMGVAGKTHAMKRVLSCEQTT